MPQLNPRLPEPNDAAYNAVYAELAPSFRSPLEQLARPRMANLLQYPLPIERGLEVACGIGAYSHALAVQSSIHVTGVDIDEASIALATEWYGATPRLDFKVANACKMTRRDEFGVVFSIDSFHHFPNLHVIFSKIHAALAPSGILYFTDFFREAAAADPVAMHISGLRRQMSEQSFLQRFFANKLFDAGDLVTNQRKVFTANSKLAAFSLEEMRAALRQAGFEDINSALSEPEVVFAAMKP